MEAPDITCVIPTYNDRIHLERAVRSALSQQGVRVEVILVDDYSDSQTRNFISCLADTDDRIRSFFLPANGGQGQARNIGATLAGGRFVVFLDQDDEHAPGWYRYAIDLLRTRADLGALSGRARIVDIPARFGIDESDLRLRGLSLVFVTNIVFRRSVFMASGGFPTSSIWRSPIAGEDGVYRMGLARNWPVVQCDQPAVIHRAKEGGATVFFLDRSEVRDNRVIMTRLEPIETNGVLQEAQNEFWEKARETAQELRTACVPLHER